MASIGKLSVIFLSGNLEELDASLLLANTYDAENSFKAVIAFLGLFILLLIDIKIISSNVSPSLSKSLLFFLRRFRINFRISGFRIGGIFKVY